eukprot:198002_1
MASLTDVEKDSPYYKTHKVLKGGCMDDNIVDIEDLYGMKTAQKCKDCNAKKSKRYYFPFRRNLKLNEIYDYCRCGRSDNFPFCDHSHTIDDVKNGKGPIKFQIVTKQGQHLLCGCRLSKGMPFCDGSHAFLSTIKHDNDNNDNNNVNEDNSVHIKSKNKL